MSLLLLAADRQQARRFAANAHDWLCANVAEYAAIKWDDPRFNSQTGQWAIAFEARIASAFSQAELGAREVGISVVWDNVINNSSAWNAAPLE